MEQEEKLKRCIQTAKLAGCPKDQVKRLMEAGYIPLPWQWTFHAIAREADREDGPVDIGLGGARGPGKSHAVLSQSALDDCQRVDKLKGLFLRQTATASKESFDDLIDKVISGHIPFERANNVLKFTNGSRIIFGGFKDERDIDKYIGIEYDFIIVEELNQISGDKYQKLRGSLRTSKPNWRPRIYTSFNAGGISHEFVKERYVIPFRENTQTKTRFVPSTYKVNPYLHTEYISYLEELQGDLGKMWREGEWDVQFGAYFTEWSFQKHVCAPFAIPLSWPKFRSIDISGHSGITSCHWYAVNNDGRVFVYREYYQTDKDYDEHAKAIYEMSLDEDGIEEPYRYTVIDNSAFAKAGFSETPAEIYNRHGVNGLIPSAKDRVPGWTLVHQYLRWDEKLSPLLQIFSTCYNLIKEIPLAQHDEKNPEDILTKYDGASHLDACLDGSTLITTIDGEVPIKNILKGELVLTREGYKKVLSSKMTNFRARTFTITLSDGKTLSGTENHPVWVENKNDFIAIGELRYGDILNVCNQKLLSSIKKDTIDILNLQTKPTEDTFLETIVACIEILGSFIMEKYQKVITYITKMVIRLITPSKTWNVNHDLNTYQNTLFNGKRKTEKNHLLTWIELDPLQKNGTQVKKDLNGIVNKEKRIGKLWLLLKKNASNVLNYFKILLDGITLSFVPLIASLRGAESQVLIISKLNASIVENPALQTNTAAFLPVQDNAVKIIGIEIDKQRKEVYNIEVEDIHEYYANGILTHNCDDLRYFLRTLRETKAVKPLTPIERKLQQNMQNEQAMDFSYARK